ncbi:MAG: enoyl-CoA hydratase/isomerase family protein [Candidatus Kariarchaeaceae archaeon]|jgi:2-(1,2-epoxy-1,2-dihydrophenyl)acetyl-CoA isomerase
MTVNLEIDENNIAILQLNRPEKYNALNLDTINSLIRKLLEIKNDPSIRGVLLTGKGASFSAGGDIDEMLKRRGKALEVKNRLENGLNQIIMLLRSIPRPVIAVVKGGAYGAGLVLALACDIIYAASDAKFGFSYGNVGLGPEGSYFFSRFLGLQQAKYLMFSRSIIPADEALSLGLITKIKPPEEVFEDAKRKITEWATGPVETMGLTKEVLNYSFEQSLENQLRYETLVQSVAFTGKEHAEGADAFLEKRKPNFFLND